MVLGSGRALLDDPSLLRTYRGGAAAAAAAGEPRRRSGCRPTPRRGSSTLLDADGLSVHLNAVQEAVQPEGEASFAGALERIAAVVEALAPLPVVVKEVGFGMSAHDVIELRDAGVAAVDVAGAGGTNWATIEGLRDPRAGAVAAAFADWGVPTAAAVTGAVGAAPGLPVLASGGLRDGVDVAKCLALGAPAAASRGRCSSPPRRAAPPRRSPSSSTSCGSPCGRAARARRRPVAGAIA